MKWTDIIKGKRNKSKVWGSMDVIPNEIETIVEDLISEYPDWDEEDKSDGNYIVELLESKVALYQKLLKALKGLGEHHNRDE